MRRSAAARQMYALKHARMGGNPEAIADVKNEVDVMKAVRGNPNVLTLRAVVMQGPPGGEVRVLLATTSFVDDGLAWLLQLSDVVALSPQLCVL